MSIQEQTKSKMAAAIEHLKTELKSIRTGRANPAMLDHVNVEIYDSQMRIKELASVTAPEPRQLLITPFDPTTKGAIAKSIERANLGFMPIVDGNVVRIKIPSMDESMRKEMIKLCHKRCEEAKVGIRNIRRDSNEAARKQKADGEIGEDILKKIEKAIQELTDKCCKEADDVTANKEKEISTI
ncbi:MAG: ribosome recycling factor [Parachlamydia sp.]|nr:ribosome recycling factor [Parachlamydia sp.]